MKNSEELIYAPVLIPTLNRYDHFVRCLESLEECTGAEKTDVYVALDYPPSEHYREGWKRIDAYLHKKENNNGFNHLIVYRRETNYFFSGKGNLTTAIKDLPECINRYILSEDDNIFSPNFLEYVNDGLEKFENDPNCLAVCGYNYQGVKLNGYNYNCYLSREYSAWGVGFWKKKREKLEYIFKIDYAKFIMSKWENIWKLYKNEPRLLNTILLNLDCGKIFGDTMLVSYQYLNNKYSLFPKTSKIRNMGFDGTGTSIFEVDNSYMSQIIDSETHFVCDMVDRKSIDVAALEVRRNFKRSWVMNIIILIRCAVYYFTKIDILYFEAKRRNKALFKD
ncbi:hypothetical protein CIK99_09165 [Prevotella sp. P5-92]|uniref:glycosyltransferase family A protein n=1 Tax=Prevotella sp. P5-92 TaxID=2024222 RepID=UPI000B9600E8|nr:glycosyltransferase family A protein [Prevotella sp. P5-92]OYP56713.1 hypothetical protein CIK99_09165 [Prevotella sp. P5-92]